MVARLALAPCTARLTRAIGRFSLLQLSSWRWLWSCSPFGCPRLATEQAAHRAPVALGHDAGAAEPPFWREDFLESRWFSLAWPRSSLPFLVTAKRLAAPRWLFILGTGVVSLLLLCARELFGW